MTILSRLGILRLLTLTGKLSGVSNLARRFPDEVGKLLVDQSTRAGALSTARDEYRNLKSGYAEARAHPDLGSLPLVVLVHGRPIPARLSISEAVVAEIEGLTQVLAIELAALSTRGRLVVATKSGHDIHVTEPELVIQAIRDVISML
jgi:hypothetical protein